MKDDMGFRIHAAGRKPGSGRSIVDALRRCCLPLLGGIILLLAVFGEIAGTEPIYMWHDDSGQVHLSDRPPPEGVDYRIWSGGLRSRDADRASPRPQVHQGRSLHVPAEGGLFWRIDHPDQRISYLLGTIHSDDPRVMRLSDAIRGALRRSERFVMEVAVDESLLLRMGTRMIMLDGSNLKSMLGERDFSKVVQAMAFYGMPAEVLQMMKPWAVMAFISTPRPKSNLFLDLKLRQQAVAQQMAVLGLETIDEQLAAFDDLAMADQVQMLKATIRQLPDLPDYFERLVRAYVRDDLNAIARLSREYQNHSGSREVVDRFMQQLNDRRNDRMVNRMMPHLNAGSTFIAVGALHLIGDRGILAQLVERGYTVTPIPK